MFIMPLELYRICIDLYDEVMNAMKILGHNSTRALSSFTLAKAGVKQTLYYTVDGRNPAPPGM